jgi:hypothetical protein
MNSGHHELFREASIHVPVEEFIRRIKAEAAGQEDTKANIRALRKALHTLGLQVESRNGRYRLCEYLYSANTYRYHAVPGEFGSTERGAMIYALGRFLCNVTN